MKEAIKVILNKLKKPTQLITCCPLVMDAGWNQILRVIMIGRCVKALQEELKVERKSFTYGK
jgi:hypothetical protein